MSWSEMLVPELDQEMATTRKMLERVPETKFGWQPHAKSMTLGRLATHLSELPGWVTMTLETDDLDFMPPGSPPYQPKTAASRDALLDTFDTSLVAARQALTGASDVLLAKPWTLKAGGKVLFTMPKMAVLRSMVFNHTVHHRAQLGVYLRLNDVALPSTYGPSADEGNM